MDEDRISHGLTLTGQQYEPSGEQSEKLKQKVDRQKQSEHPPTQKVDKKDQEEKQEVNDKKDNTEEDKELQKQKEIDAEPLHQDDKTSKLEQQQHQEGNQEHNTTKEDDGKVEPSTGLPVSSCKLHSLGIVQLTKEGHSGDSNKPPSRNKKDVDSFNIDPSLLIGVSFCRSSGAQDAAIMVYHIHNSPTWKGVPAAAKKNKSNSTYLSSAIEPMADTLLEIDDAIPSGLPITVDIDTPSWELVPPLPLPPELPLVSSSIPPAPPPPPLKNSSAHKAEKESQLQIFVVSEYIDDLPNDAHPVVSVIKPCGRSQVAVALEYGPNYGGSIILFNLEHCTGKTILGKSVIFEFKTPDLQVMDMCVMENLETGRTGSSHFLATVNRRGSFNVFSMGMNVVVSMDVSNDPLVSCFPCVNVGLFGMVTRSGVVKTVKVVSGKPAGEVNIMAASAADNGTVDETILISPHKG